VSGPYNEPKPDSVCGTRAFGTTGPPRNEACAPNGSGVELRTNVGVSLNQSGVAKKE